MSEKHTKRMPVNSNKIAMAAAFLALCWSGVGCTPPGIPGMPTGLDSAFSACSSEIATQMDIAAQVRAANPTNLTSLTWVTPEFLSTLSTVPEPSESCQQAQNSFFSQNVRGFQP